MASATTASFAPAPRGWHPEDISFPSGFAWGAATAAYQVEGVDYYDKIIDDLLANSIVPMVTLYHFDLPQHLEDQGGWSSDAITEVFDSYAQFCFRAFGDRVKLWVTINEPYVVAKDGYEKGIVAPGIMEPGIGAYRTAHNMIKAHAKAWHSYDLLFREKQHGLVSIALNSDWAEPLDPTCLADQEATKRYMAFCLDWFAEPIFISGDYPAIMKSQISVMSTKQGYLSSRLPEFTEEEKMTIKGTADFFSLNYYTTRKVKRQKNTHSEPSVSGDREAEQIMDHSWPFAAGSSWLAVVPWGLRRLLKYIKDTYNNPIIYITENGFSQSDPAPLDDTQRWKYFRLTLQEILKGRIQKKEGTEMAVKSKNQGQTFILQSLMERMHGNFPIQLVFVSVIRNKPLTLACDVDGTLWTAFPMPTVLHNEKPEN
nr:cytosolic beta-glucosidase-like isoform X2 [Caretta caretta]